MWIVAGIPSIALAAAPSATPSLIGPPTPGPCWSGWPQGSPVASFRDLPADEEIEIEYHSNGCFHDTIHRLLYRGGPAPTLTVITVSTTFSRYTHQTADPNVHIMALDTTEVAALDRLLAHYRGPKARSTTTESLALVQRRKGFLVTSETLCGSPPLEWPRWITLDQLITRVETGRHLDPGLDD